MTHKSYRPQTMTGGSCRIQIKDGRNIARNYRSERMDMTKFAGSESKYLKASDLKGKRVRVTIAGVNLVEFDDEEKGKHTKPSLRFENREKELVLNVTNCTELIQSFGEESEGWIGKDVGLSTKYYKAFDREGIVVTPVVPEAGPNDDIPF